MGEGLTLQTLMGRVAHHYGIDLDDIRSETKARYIVEARSVLCYIAVRHLRATAAAVAAELNITPSAVSKSRNS